MTEPGPLEGLRVIGFHGSVGPRQTPARVAPVYVDDDEWYVAVRRLPDGTIERERSELRHDRVGSADGFTRFDEPLPARLDWRFLVIGDREREHLHLIERGDATAAHKIKCALRGELGIDCLAYARCPARVHVNSTVALYLSPADAAIVWSELGRAARAALDEACVRNDNAAIEDAAWWLKNAAADREDVLRAIAGLARASSRHFRSLAQMYFPEVEINAMLARVREVEGELPQPTGPTGSGSGKRWADTMRDDVRSRFMLGRAA